LVLSYLGAKAQGQNPSADDTDLVAGVIDSVVDGLKPTGSVFFALSAIPEWAQVPLTEMVAVKVGPHFGRPQQERVFNNARADFVGAANNAEQKRPAKGKFY